MKKSIFRRLFLLLIVIFLLRDILRRLLINKGICLSAKSRDSLLVNSWESPANYSRISGLDRRSSFGIKSSLGIGLDIIRESKRNPIPVANSLVYMHARMCVSGSQTTNWIILRRLWLLTKVSQSCKGKWQMALKTLKSN